MVFSPPSAREFQKAAPSSRVAHPCGFCKDGPARHATLRSIVIVVFSPRISLQEEGMSGICATRTHAREVQTHASGNECAIARSPEHFSNMGMSWGVCKFCGSAG